MFTVCIRLAIMYVFTNNRSSVMKALVVDLIIDVFCNGNRSSWRLSTVSVDRLVDLVLMRDKSCLEEGTELTRMWRGNQHMHMLRVLVVNKSAHKSVQGQRES